MAEVVTKLSAVSLVCTIILLNVVNGNTRADSERKVRANPVISSKGSPWPMPQSMTTTKIPMDVNADQFMFVLATPYRCDDLQDAFIRYKKLIFGPESSMLRFRPYIARPHGRSDSVVTSLNVSVLSSCVQGALPDLQSDESYTLMVDDLGNAMLSAQEVWGALRGLETFSQLVYRTSNGGFAVNQTNISDFPRFKHRGLLLDTSRHFLSMNILKANLDVMAQNKFNVFHWHIVDDQSFPYESYTFPDMSAKGAYSPVRHVYSQSNIKELIEYARQRGIRVIPEFDSPGHTLSWGKAIMNLLTTCYTSGQPNGNFGPVNPAYNSTFQFLNQFFTEIASVFPDKYVHLGGDEVSFDCWKSNPDVTAFMQQMGFGTDYSKLEEYYVQKLLDIVNKLNKAYIIWQEVIDNGAQVAQDTVVTVWKGGFQKELARVTSLGYKTLLSSPWYVNYISYGRDWPKYYDIEPLDFNDTVVEVWKGGYQAELAKVTGLGYKTLLSACWYLDLISYGTQWNTYYECDPQQFNGTDAQKNLVMGGEACIWGEFVDDTNLLQRLWPRASAVAERLWSASTVNDSNAASPRIEEMRCRLVRRGYPAEPPNGPSFCDDEYVY